MALNFIIGRFVDEPREDGNDCKRLLNVDVSDDLVEMLGGERAVINAIMMSFSLAHGEEGLVVRDVTPPLGPPAGALSPEEIERLVRGQPACPKCHDTGVIETGNNDLRCDCPAGTYTRLNTSS